MRIPWFWRWWLGAVLISIVSGCVLAREGTQMGSDGGARGNPTDTTTTSSGGGVGGEGGTTMSASTTSSSAATSSGGGGGQAVEVDCLDGLDDDRDGATDCDDPDCEVAGYTCLPVAPGALAQLVLMSGTCPTATESKTLRTCDAEACDCTGGTDGLCSFGVARWNGSLCNGSSDSSLKTESRCYVISGSASAFQGTASPLGGATCPLTPSDVAAGAIEGCEITAGGTCSGGGICVPPDVPVSQGCAILPAGSSCAAPYDGYQQEVFDDPGTSCSCSCGKTGELCDGTIATYTNYTCSGSPAGTAPIDGQCHSQGYIESYAIGLVVAHPQCSASATMPAGEATLCCSTAP